MLRGRRGGGLLRSHCSYACSYSRAGDSVGVRTRASEHTGGDALLAWQERTWWEREVRQKVEEVVRGLLGFAVAAWEAEDEVWKLLDLVALEGAKMKEELVQTKENANAEAALLNAQKLSLQNMCAEQEEQVQALLELDPDFGLLGKVDRSGGG